MAVCSLGFLALCVAVVLLFHLPRAKFARQSILALASVLFLATQVPNWRSWAFFIVVLALTYGMLLLVHVTRRGGIVACAIGFLVLIFLYVKRYTFFSSWVPVPMDWDLDVHPVELVGLSYMFFKLIHMLVDECQGQLASFNFWSYFNYQLSFFTLTAGPIQRYNDFLHGWEEMDLRPRDADAGLRLWGRLLGGLLKISILGAWALAAYDKAAPANAPLGLANVLVCFYAYPAYLYFNFSGYTDVMLGAGGLLGFKLPENFNQPYLARNVLDFWDRWHISVTHWIRDYIFMTSYKTAATHFPRAARWWSYVLLFAALFFAGIWHGTTANYVVFGALNGLGAAVTRAYGDGLRSALGGPGVKAYLQNRTIRRIAVVVTLHYVGFCFLFFAMSPHEVQLLLTAAWRDVLSLPASLGDTTWSALHGLLLGAAVAALIALWQADAIGSGVRRLTAAILDRRRLMYSIVCTQTLVVVLVLYFEWAFQQEAPPVLYMHF
jgi:D-alanyl-lipoteichoic acid acyltransferase DltB (MBOAT superfamily)